MKCITFKNKSGNIESVRVDQTGEELKSRKGHRYFITTTGTVSHVFVQKSGIPHKVGELVEFWPIPPVPRFKHSWIHYTKKFLDGLPDKKQFVIWYLPQICASWGDSSKRYAVSQILDHVGVSNDQKCWDVMDYFFDYI